MRLSASGSMTRACIKRGSSGLEMSLFGHVGSSPLELSQLLIKAAGRANASFSQTVLPESLPAHRL